MKQIFNPCFILSLFLTIVSCKEDEPAPALSIISIKSGAVDLNTGTAATKVSVSSPILVTLSTGVDATTATSSNIKLSKGTSNVAINISAAENTITITPASALLFDMSYSLIIGAPIKSDKGVNLSSQASVSFTTESNPAPPLSVISIKSGTTDLNGGTSATKVSISLPIVVVLSTKVDATTATSTNITLTKGTSNVAIGISVGESTITITPTNNLAANSNYSLTITTAVKSDKAASLTSQVSLSFTTDEPNKVFFHSVTATPTDQESITIKNNSGTDQDLSDWTIGDSNNPVAYNIPNGTILKHGETKTFPHTTLGFAINDSGEILYLKNAGVEIDRWTN